MALDFDLKLIMPEDSMSVFSRGGLEMTAKLINSSAPDLADEINDLLNEPALPTGNEKEENPHQQMFHIEFTPDKVKTITRVILDIMETGQHKLSPGMIVVAKALFKDWMELAQSQA